MAEKPTIAVISGGRSGEHEVSLRSAAAILAALDPAKYDVVSIVVGKDGLWADGTGTAKVAVGMGGVLLFDGSPRKIDVAIPMIHGTYGEDGCLQGTLEMTGIPYVGAGVLGSALGMDKDIQKKLLADAGIPVTQSVSVDATGWQRAPGAFLSRCEDELTYPMFVKPVALGSSVGISKAKSRAALRRAIDVAFAYDGRVIVERGVHDARELEIGVIGDGDLECSVVGEIVPSNEFYDYAAKYVDGRSQMHIPADISAEQTQRIVALARQAFAVLRCSGLARIDFLLSRSSGELILNEANTLPGFTDASMFAKLWEASGVPFPALLDRLIALAVARAHASATLIREFAAAPV